MSHPIRIVLALMVVALVAGPALAVSPKYWIHDTASEFLQGEVDGVSITRDGTLRLSPKVEELAELEEPYVWDVAVDGQERVYVGDRG